MHLVSAVDDVSAVLIGLLGDWKVMPRWLEDSIRQAIARDPRRLVQRLIASHLAIRFKRFSMSAGIWRDLPGDVKKPIDQIETANSYVQAALFQCAQEVFYVAEQLSIPAIVLKGLACAGRLYDDPLERVVDDIDLLAPADQSLELFLAVNQLGYRAGYFDNVSGRIVETGQLPSVTDQAYELPRQSKLVEIEGGCDAVVLEGLSDPRIKVSDGRIWVASSIEIHYAFAPQLPLEWSREPVVNGPLATLWGQDATSQLIYVCYKAYTDLFFFSQEKAAKLLADAIRLLSRAGSEIDFASAAEQARRLRVLSPLYYVVRHAQHLFGINLPAEALKLLYAEKSELIDVGDPLSCLLQCRSLDLVKISLAQ
jgi:hypothetical protein